MILLKQTDYAYSTAYIRALENKLLSKNDIEGLITAKDFKAAVQILRDNGYGDGDITPSTLDDALNKALEESRGEALWASPKDNILNIFLYKNDFHNLKAVLKVSASGGKDFERFILTPATIDYKEFIDAAANFDFSNLPEYIKEVAHDAFDILNRTGDGALSDTLIDKACMDYMLSEAKKTGNEFLIGLISLENTMTDIKIAQRCAKALKDRSFLEKALSEASDIDRTELINAAVSDSVCDFLEEKGKSDEAKALLSGLGEFEKLADNKLNDYIKTAKYVTFGAEPVIAYILKKQAEVQTIRVVLSAKHNGIADEEIRKRIRDI